MNGQTVDWSRQTPPWASLGLFFEGLLRLTWGGYPDTLAPYRAPGEWNNPARFIILVRQSYVGASVMDHGDRREDIFTFAGQVDCGAGADSHGQSDYVRVPSIEPWTTPKPTRSAKTEAAAGLRPASHRASCVTRVASITSGRTKNQFAVSQSAAACPRNCLTPVRDSKPFGPAPTTQNGPDFSLTGLARSA